jgi:hypothetical protein
MKIKNGFSLRQIADTWVAVPLGGRAAEFNGLIAFPNFRKNRTGLRRLPQEAESVDEEADHNRREEDDVRRHAS